MCLKMQPLILSGLAYKLRSGALWRRRHSSVQNDENAPCSTPTESHEPYAGHEGTYRSAVDTGSSSQLNSNIIQHALHSHHHSISKTSTPSLHTTNQYLPNLNFHSSPRLVRTTLKVVSTSLAVEHYIVKLVSFRSRRWHPLNGLVIITVWSYFSRTNWWLVYFWDRLSCWSFTVN